MNLIFPSKTESRNETNLQKNPKLQTFKNSKNIPISDVRLDMVA
jgi:hypothetical protein